MAGTGELPPEPGRRAVATYDRRMDAPPSPLHVDRFGLHAALRRFGLWPMVLALTALSVCASAAIVAAVTSWGFGSGMTPHAWTVTLLAPALIAPLPSALTLHLVQRLDRLQETLNEVIHVDELTALRNRRYFMQALQREVERARRDGSRFALALVDVDNFKDINDGYGHPAGDMVLRHIADACRQAVRETDVAARIGGEEFAFLFPDGTADLAREIGTRLLAGVRELELRLQGARLKLSVSVGLTIMQGSQAELTQALRLADQALYAAKAAGKDRLEMAAPA